MQSVKQETCNKISYVLLACQIHRHSGVPYGRREKPVATASRSRWRHSIRQM